MSVSMGREIQKNNSLFHAVLFLALLSSFLWTTTTEPDNRGAGYRFPERISISVFSPSSRSALVPTRLSVSWVSEVKELEREPDHSPPYSAVAKTAWTIRLYGTMLN
jgi:hypothetical protein